MAANINDKFSRTFNGIDPNVAKVDAPRSTGVTTLECDDLTGWPLTTSVKFLTYRQDPSDPSKPVDSSVTSWRGIVVGNTITGIERLSGAADAGNLINDVVLCSPTGSWANDVILGILEQHKQDGSHGAVTATSVTTTDAITAGNGLNVTGPVSLPAGSLSTPAYGDGTVTSSKITNSCRFRVRSAVGVALNTSYAVMTFDTKDFGGTYIDVATNKGRFTAPVGGYYQLNATVGCGSVGRITLALYKNGSVYAYGNDLFVASGTGATARGVYSDCIYLAANDYVDIRAAADAARTTDTTMCSFSGFMVSQY